jgi:hypothetical protein
VAKSKETFIADLGLEVWFSPFTYQLGPGEMLNLLAAFTALADYYK